MAYVKILLSPFQLFFDAKPPTIKAETIFELTFSFKLLLILLKACRSQWKKWVQRRSGRRRKRRLRGHCCRWPVHAPASWHTLISYLTLSILIERSNQLCSAMCGKSLLSSTHVQLAAAITSGQFNSSPSIRPQVQLCVKGRVSAFLICLVHLRPKAVPHSQRLFENP